MLLNINEKLEWDRDNPRTDQDKTEIRKKIASAIAPILDAHGFVKVSSTFLRLHGDCLLQSVSVCYRAHEQPSLQMLSTPLYNFEKWWNYYFQGIRSHCGLEGHKIETVAGLIVQRGDDNSYLAYQTDIDAALVKEIELLKTDTIPRLDRMTTGLDSFRVLYPKMSPYDSFMALADLIRQKEYARAADLYKKRISEYQEDLDELLKVQANPDKRLNWWGTEEKLARVIRANEKELASLQSKLSMLRENRINDFCPLMNASMDEAYVYLGKLSKRFVQKYPRPPYFESIV